MARCGWCNQTGLGFDSEGNLEVHFMSWAKKTCRNQDNPSLILVKHKAEISQQRPDRQATGFSVARTMLDRADNRSKTRALATAKRKNAERNFIPVVRSRKP